MTAHAGDICPCGSGGAYASCCAPFIDGPASPPTAEALMRSRYTAYTLGRVDYLRATWHPTTCPPVLEPTPGLRWLGLRIKRVEAGGVGDSTGSVEFVARCKLAGRADRLHETSRFERVDGRWVYRHGEMHSR